MLAVFPELLFMIIESRALRQYVLLIDDDESVAGSLFQYLSTQGCDVHVADDAPSAARMMASRQYDVVLVDPYLTGWAQTESQTLFESIRVLQPQTSMIVLTGYVSPQLRIAADASEAAAVLSKPQSVTAVSQVIADALGSRAGTTFTHSIKG